MCVCVCFLFGLWCVYVSRKLILNGQQPVKQTRCQVKAKWTKEKKNQLKNTRFDAISLYLCAIFEGYNKESKSLCKQIYKPILVRRVSRTKYEYVLPIDWSRLFYFIHIYICVYSSFLWWKVKKKKTLTHYVWLKNKAKRLSGNRKRIEN